MVRSNPERGGQGSGSSHLPSLPELSEEAFWFALDGDRQTALREAGCFRVFARGTPIMHQGDESDHVVVIESGWAKVTSATADGQEVVLAVRGPGDLVGESALTGGRERSATIKALSNVRALVIPAARFTAFLDAHPEVWLLVSSTVVRRLDDADRRLRVHLTSRGLERLALLLADLAELSAGRVPPGPDGSIEIGPPLSQEELGRWMDASRETVARSLGALRRQGLVRTDRRKITVVDPSGLRAFGRTSRAQHGEAGVSRPRSARFPHRRSGRLRVT
ncbi:Crp/Fnr family transcriptional regulator [Actinomadura sp. NPDC049753]|uniref:Crp/Fnr family transcriptional regulator n=1 Tax=Actinomadura sp. NPDC049753 TaxID=3154739 RepID=UPI0034324342